MMNFLYWLLPLAVAAIISSVATYFILFEILKGKKEEEDLEQREGLLDAQRDAAVYQVDAERAKIEVSHLAAVNLALEEKIKSLEPYQQNAEVLNNNLAEANATIRELRLKESEYRDIDEKLVASVESTSRRFGELIEDISRLSSELAAANAQLILERSKNRELTDQVSALTEAKEKLKAFSSASLVLRTSKGVKNTGALVYDRSALNEATS